MALKRTPPTDREKLIEGLNVLLASLKVQTNNLYAVHWNLEKTPSFITFHNYFGDLYELNEKHQDMIAEFVRIYNGIPLFTMTEFLEKSTIMEAEFDATNDLQMALSKAKVDTRVILATVREIFRETEKFPDVNDYMAEMVADYGKRNWFLRSSMDEQD